jgi:mannose-6-phosphate isomerase-like protein (cupin superfamily)
MVEKISRASAEHYNWGDTANSCDGWHLLRSAELSVIEERMPPGTREQRHRHRHSRQMFYVLEGELTMESAGSVHTLRAGEALEVAPQVPHQPMNRSAADARFLVISQPPSHGDRELAQPA